MLGQLKLGETEVFGSEVLGESEYRDQSGNFSVKLGDEVRIINRKDQKLSSKVVTILGKDFIVLSTDKSRSSVSFLQKLKLYWNLLGS